MAGLDPAMPLIEAPPCDIIGIAGVKPGDDGLMSSFHRNMR
jgi:hypothetical protein